MDDRTRWVKAKGDGNELGGRCTSIVPTEYPHYPVENRFARRGEERRRKGGGDDDDRVGVGDR